jgi:integrase
VVELPIAERASTALPLLLLGEGTHTAPSVFAAAYVRNKQLEGYDPKTLFRHVKAIGLLYDFYVLELKSQTLNVSAIQVVIRQFWEARRWGCSGLGWTPVSLKTARDDLNAVTEFSDFCGENFGHSKLNPQEQVLVSSLSHKEFRSWVSRLAHRKKTDLLFHLSSSTKEGRGHVMKRRFDPERGASRVRGVASPKHFPPNKVIELIEETRSLRNRLCWLLMFYGGLRISELAHIFINDIMSDPATGAAKVCLANPVDGKMTWHLNDRTRKGTRTAFLAEKYGRIPRSELPSKDPEHAGWKGMLLDDANTKQSYVNWIDPRIGILFWKLHAIYMRTARIQAGDDHPYYFISLRGNSFGEPMKLGALRKQFYAAAERINLSPKTQGVNPHGCRHFYGWYCANLLKLPKEQAQKLMHHSSMLSTEIYYRLEDATVRAELQSAQDRLLNRMPSFLESPSLLLTSVDDNE